MHSSFIHNSSILKNLTVHQWLNRCVISKEWNTTHNKKEWASDTCYNMDKPQKYYLRLETQNSTYYIII